MEEAAGGRRLVLACGALVEDGTLCGVVFTTLIAARGPRVAVAPPLAPIPATWRPVDELADLLDT